MLDHSTSNIFDIILNPWYEGLEDPSKTQIITLRKLLQTYSKTQYGIDHNSLDVTNFQEYRNNFPKIRYSEIKVYLEKVKDETILVFFQNLPKTGS